METKKSGYAIFDSACRRVAVGLDIEVPVGAGHMGFEMAHREMARVDKEFAAMQTESAM